MSTLCYRHNRLKNSYFVFFYICSHVFFFLKKKNLSSLNLTRKQYNSFKNINHATYLLYTFDTLSHFHFILRWKWYPFVVTLFLFTTFNAHFNRTEQLFTFTFILFHSTIHFYYLFSTPTKMIYGHLIVRRFCLHKN